MKSAKQRISVSAVIWVIMALSTLMNTLATNNTRYALRKQVKAITHGNQCLHKFVPPGLTAWGINIYHKALCFYEAAHVLIWYAVKLVAGKYFLFKIINGRNCFSIMKFKQEILSNQF